MIFIDIASQGLYLNFYSSYELDEQIVTTFPLNIDVLPSITYIIYYFQMLKHKSYDKLPLQANVYPMPAMSYIEDDGCRFSVLSAQSLGMSALKTGTVKCFNLLIRGVLNSRSDNLYVSWLNIHSMHNII